MNIKGTEFILRSLVADGVGCLFTVPGGLIDPFYGALQRVGELRPVVAAQEGGAAYMADGYARAGGSFGAYLCIGGPGLTNTVTALAAAQSDESPILALSGEIATYMEGLGAFQDASAGTFNDTALVDAVTKYSCSVPHYRLLHHKYRRAVKEMFSAPCGPVHLSLPKDVQEGDLDISPAPVEKQLLNQQPLDADAAARFWKLFKEVDVRRNGARVAALVGRGARHDSATGSLVAVAEKLNLPTATTLGAKGVFPENHPLSLGVFGYAGTPRASAALLGGDLDLLLVLGSGMNERDSMSWSDKLRPAAGVVHVNVSNRAVGCFTDDYIFIEGHAGAFLHQLGAVLETDGEGLEPGRLLRDQWLSTIRSSVPRFSDEETMASSQVPIHPARIVTDCRAVMPSETVVLCDSGAHRAFVVHYWQSHAPGEFLSASNLGPMGWAIPAGVGVKAALPDRPVVVFTGDGCMQMHGIEIQTAARYGLPVVFVVFANGALGNVWLRAHKEGPVPGEITSLVDHDWAMFARSLGLEAETVRDPEELKPAFRSALGSGKAYLVDVKTEKDCETPAESFREARAEWSYHE
ncbi:MAG: thiamine pyrophosphate-binding protein [Candidatus Geothermincolia bacterium]